MSRLEELLVLASGEDDDVVLQVASEIALMPETPRQRNERLVASFDEIADGYAPVQETVDEEVLSELADEAGF